MDIYAPRVSLKTTSKHDQHDIYGLRTAAVVAVDACCHPLVGQLTLLPAVGLISCVL